MHGTTKYVVLLNKDVHLALSVECTACGDGEFAGVLSMFPM